MADAHVAAAAGSANPGPVHAREHGPKQLVVPREVNVCFGAMASACKSVLMLCGVLFLLGLLEYRIDMNRAVCVEGTVRPYAERDEASAFTWVYDVEEWLERSKSLYQEGEVFQSRFFGKVMLLDGEVMITERDEAHYHEMLAHVPLAYAPTAKKVLLIGGGDGGTLGQVLKHSNIESVTMVEIDQMVVDMSRRHFPKLGAAYDDPRTHLVLENGGTWIRNRVAEQANGTARHPLGGPFDAVLVDSTDHTNANSLFTDAFYASVKALLAPRGIVAFNIDSPSWTLPTIAAVSRQISQLYKHAMVYQVYQPTYASGHYAFMFASDAVHPLRTPVDWAALESKHLQTHYYTPDVHVAAFALPAFVEGVVHQRTRLAEHFAIQRSSESARET